MSSSRLRSRLAHGDFDAAQAAKATENFVLIGTPLPSLDKRDPNEGKPVWEQEVRDEQGRRRFHGAFTGGWSAGYYNTVGSKEGWTPSTFVSSRSARGRAGQQSSGSSAPGSVKQARPEDFMDEEDLAELQESRKLGHREGYASVDDKRHQDEVLGDLLGLGSSARRQIENADAAETGLIAPRSSLGHRILTRMGWRPGSGIGPRVTAQRRRLMEEQYLSSPASGASFKQSSEPADNATVPPPDTPMPALVGGGSAAKRDTHGLGWQSGGGGGGPATSTRDTLMLAGARQQGFDISVLEEADEDDVANIYAQSESIQATIDRRRKAAQKQAPTAFRTLASNEETTTTTTWRDGTPLPPGFIIDSISISIIDSRQEHKQQDWFPPPEVPPQWKPDPVRVWARAKAGAAPPPPPSQARNQGRSGPSHLQAADRAQLLGEVRMPGPPPSLANYLPSAPQSQSQPQPQPEPEPTSVLAPKLDITTAKAALGGFIPFGTDPGGKQKRYIAYLESQADASKRGEELQPVPAGKTAAQVRAELEEFARSASIFKPLSSAMANRFASAVTSEGAGDGHAPTPGLYQPEAKSKEDRREEAKRRAEEEQARLRREREAGMNDRQRAAQASMFGHLTREVKTWDPPRLLCKRFGVPEPLHAHAGKGLGRGEEPSSGEDMHAAMGRIASRDEAGDPFYGSSGKDDAFQRSDARRELKRGEARWEKSKRELLSLVGQRQWEAQGGQPLAVDVAVDDDAPASTARAHSDVPPALENVGLGEDESQLRELDTVQKKPSRDVFKSVFASDEEDAEDDGEDQDEVKSAQLPGAAPQSVTGTGAGTGTAADSSITANAAPGLGLVRPTFVPRKKRLDATTADADDAAEASSHAAKKRKKEDKTKKTTTKKKGAWGALTFDFEEEAEEEQGGKKRREARERDTHAAEAEGKPAGEGPRPDEGPSSSPQGEEQEKRPTATSTASASATAERRARTKAADLF